MKTIQQKLADRIYELLPEKLELTFGCETSEGIFLKQNKDKGYFFTEENLNIVSKNEFKLLGIKGQPIRLADVLKALNIKYKKDIFGYMELLLCGNDVVKITYKEKEAEYNLSQDNILNQSDEFCEFVYNLIK